jgi:tRNA(fMet)-specific endonuclease VapC
VAFLLDTDICIYLIREKPLQVIQRIQKMRPTELAISSVTFAELSYGVAKSQQAKKNQKALQRLISSLQIKDFDQAAALEYGKIRAHLEKKGRVIGPMDMLIAAHCRSQSDTLVTNNENEFRRVPGLTVENWAK